MAPRHRLIVVPPRTVKSRHWIMPMNPTDLQTSDPCCHHPSTSTILTNLHLRRFAGLTLTFCAIHDLVPEKAK
jgi:hypothetical protein